MLEALRSEVFQGRPSFDAENEGIRRNRNRRRPRHELVALRRLVHIDLSVGCRTIFRDHVDELAERVRSACESEPSLPLLKLAAVFDALAENGPGELRLQLDPEGESVVLQTIDEWKRDAHKLPDDVLALRHALRRRGI